MTLVIHSAKSQNFTGCSSHNVLHLRFPFEGEMWVTSRCSMRNIVGMFYIYNASKCSTPKVVLTLSIVNLNGSFPFDFIEISHVSCHFSPLRFHCFYPVCKQTMRFVKQLHRSYLTETAMIHCHVDRRDNLHLPPNLDHFFLVNTPCSNGFLYHLPHGASQVHRTANQKGLFIICCRGGQTIDKFNNLLNV